MTPLIREIDRLECMISQLSAQASHDTCDGLRDLLDEWPSARSLLLSEQERSAALYRLARTEYELFEGGR